MATSRNSTVAATKPNDRENAQAVLRWHRLHNGVYAKVARKLGVDPSYVSRVATGERRSGKIQEALISELQKIQAKWPGKQQRSSQDQL